MFPVGRYRYYKVVHARNKVGGYVPKTGMAKAKQRARPAHSSAIDSVSPEYILCPAQRVAARVAEHAATTEKVCAWRLSVSMAPVP